MDFHLVNILERVTAESEEVQPALVNKQDRTFLKFVKWKHEELGVVSFNPLVFVLVYKVDISTIKILLISYNEEILEDIETKVNTDVPIADSLITHIVYNLSRLHSPCIGVPEDCVTDSDLDNLLLEKYGDKIYIRSKKCTRVLFDEKGVCSECSKFENLNQIFNLESSIREPKPTIHVGVNNPPLEVKPVPKNCSNRRQQHCGEDTSPKLRCDFDFCDRQFGQDIDLAVHLLKSHPGVKHHVLERFVSCPRVGCDKLFDKEQPFELEQHMKLCPEQPLSSQCQVCFKTFKSMQDLRKHIAGVHEAPSLTCHICGAVIKGAKPMRNHLKLVHGDTKFYCPEPGCKVSAKNKDHIKDHIAAVHLKEPRYVCSVCGVRYKYRNKWKYCEDKHKGRFLHTCSQCKKQFNEKGKLEIHLRTHTGEKPYACPICNFRMARRDNLNSHTKKTHGLTWREAEKLTTSSSSNNYVNVVQGDTTASTTNSSSNNFILTGEEQCIGFKTVVEEEVGLRMVNCKQILDDIKPLGDPYTSTQSIQQCHDLQ